MSRLPTIAIARRAALAAVVVGVAVVLLALVEGAPAAHADTDPVDLAGDAALDGGGGAGVDGIAYLAPGQPGQPGQPGGRWGLSSPVVDFCTQQLNRPASISAEAFRATVADATHVWNAVEAAVGVRYTGDCEAAEPWRSRNAVNEVAWDDDRQDVSGSQSAITEARWLDLGDHVEFAEADIVLSRRLAVPERCLGFVVRHEMGHALGFGHSEWQGDLMYASFSSTLPSTCVQTPSPREVAWLRALYGTNRAPVLAPPLVQSLLAGRPAEVAVAAADPERDRVTYTWTQSGGVPVALEARGPIASFVAPPGAGASLMFTVEAVDPYMHRTTATVTAVTVDAAAVPQGTPELLAVHLAGATGRTALEWSSVTGATSYRVCRTDGHGGGRSCRDSAAPAATMDWPVALDGGSQAFAVPRAGDGPQALTIAACNAEGCAAPSTPVHLGGVRSSGGDADFDVIGVATDGAGGTPVTTGGVFGVAGPPRHVALYAGTPDEPLRVLIRDCGVLHARASCLGSVASGEAGALPLITATSTITDPATGEPSTLRYAVRVR